ncbi:hypothetical protein M419DRAFT_120873, partial [Trichoderma reesei RUT C-30]
IWIDIDETKRQRLLPHALRIVAQVGGYQGSTSKAKEVGQGYMEAVYSAVESEGAKPRGSIGVEGEDMTLFFGV